MKAFKCSKCGNISYAGVREGRRQERGNWVQALSHMKEIDEALLGRVIGEVAKLYEGEG